MAGSFAALLLAALPAAAETFLVVPFENFNRVPDLEWVGESFAETLTQRLAGSGYTLVTREERLAALERLDLPATAPLTRASLLRLGEELQADWVVCGRFTVADGVLSGQAQLLDLRRLRLSDSIEERGSFAELLTLQTQLAWKILRSLDPTFPLSQQAFQQRFPALLVSAFESYVRGLLAPNRDQQRRYFLQAARLDSNYSLPAFRLAQLYYEDQDYPTAARWFSRIAADDNLGLDARFYLALCQFYAGDFPHAVETLAPLAERLPVKQVLNNLGVFASRQGTSEAAAGYFARALAADPNDADIYFNLGLHHLRREEWDEAARALEKCVELNPGDTEAHFLHAHALERLGRTQEAERARQQAVGDNPALGLSLERRQLDLDRLQQDFSSHLARPRLPHGGNPTAASVRDEHVAVHIQRGEDLLARGNLREAQGEFTAAVLLDPGSYRAHYYLGEIYQRQGRSTEAIAELKASLWSQETVRARLLLAEIYLSRSRWAEAREQIRAALVLDPGNTAARALEARLPPPAAGPEGQSGKPQ